MAEYRTVTAVATVSRTIFNADGTVSTMSFDVTADAQRVTVVDPYIEIEQTEDGAVVTVTDVRGSTQATIYNGPQGPQGETGPQGAQGPQGEKGDKGDKGDTGDTGETGPQGPQGEKGDKGDKGDTGATGPQGIQGIQGETGPQGPKGDQGDPGATGPQGEKGDKGDTGATGATGPAGPAGPQGEQGPKGDTGATGSTGPAGPTGPQGPKGDKGDPGDVGEKTVIQIRNRNPYDGVDGYTLTDADGNQLTWQEVHDAYYSPAGAVFERDDSRYTATAFYGSTVRIVNYWDDDIYEFVFDANSHDDYLFCNGYFGGRVMFKTRQRAVALIVENSGAYYITWYGSSTPLAAAEVTEVYLSMESLVFLAPLNLAGSALFIMNAAATNMSSGAMTFEGVVVDEYLLQPTKRISMVFYPGQDGILSASISDIRFYPLTSEPAVSGGTDLSLVTTGEKYTWNNKGTYTKPSGGIPASDLANTYAGSATAGGAASNTEGIPYGEVDSTSTSTVFTATVPGITELKDGTVVLLKNGVVTSAANFTININSLGAKPAYSNMATGNDTTPTAPTRETTIFNINYTMMFIYNTTLVDGGAWICYRGYDANTNTIGYQLRTNSQNLAVSGALYRYRLLFQSLNGRNWIPANTTNSTDANAQKTTNTAVIDPFGEIMYYGSTTVVSSGSRPSVSALWQQYALNIGYSFNTTGAAPTLTSWRPVYLRATPQATGGCKISSTPYTQTLPTADDTHIYILLGIAYNATNIELLATHPVYCFMNGRLQMWTGNNDAPVLPSVSASDNDKFLRVVNSAWAAVTVPNASGNSFGT